MSPMRTTAAGSWHIRMTIVASPISTIEFPLRRKRRHKLRLMMVRPRVSAGATGESGQDHRNDQSALVPDGDRRRLVQVGQKLAAARLLGDPHAVSDQRAHAKQPGSRSKANGKECGNEQQIEGPRAAA
jgi:hypothetical protein